MALFRRKQEPGLLPPPAPPRSTPNRPASAPSANHNQSATSNGTDWSDIANIRKEWPQSQLDVDADLRKWREGIALYENDDYMSMMKCATLLSSALAHALYGEGILHGDEFPDTIFKVLYASLEPPPDGRSFPDGPQRSTRLALTMVRENGWSPASMRGSGLFDKLIMDKGNYMLLMMAVSP